MELSSNRAVARIFLNNILHNINEYKKIKSKDIKICAVVKADAYGHGSVEVSNFIQDNVDYFAVSTGDEALELRSANIIKPILILGYVSEGEIENLIKENVEFTIYNLEIAQLISQKAKKMNKKAKVQIKLDTGMSRIGFLKQDDYISKIKTIYELENIEIVGCFSHFASADETKNSFNDTQFELFCEMCQNIEKTGINLGIKHISNSAGAENSKYDLDMLRIGIGMYGYSLNDIKNESLNLLPAMRLESIVSSVKYLESGNTISYGRHYTNKQDEWIITIPIGYADGISRCLSNKDLELVFEGGIKGIAVGNVCMDQMMIKSPQKIELGKRVYIFGYDLKSGYYISDKASTIIDETLCNVHKRVKRDYEKTGDITKI